MQGEDRISKLPDELLHRVLSFLTSPQAVRTSVLSPRWRDVWASAPCVNLDAAEFADVDAFEQFGNTALLLREPVQLRALGIRSGEDVSEASKKWMLHAVRHGVQVLELAVNAEDPYEIPGRVFMCGTLEEANLELDTDIMGALGPGVVSLGRLKKLRLSCVQVYDYFVEQLAPGCPVLEDLILDRCKLSFSEIGLRSLKKFTINDCGFDDKIRVSSPNRVSLSLRGPVLWGCSFVYLLCRVKTCGHGDYELDVDGSEGKLLERFSDATHLALFGSEVKVMLEHELPRSQIFSSLESLSLGGWCMADDFRPVARFLHHSPNLQRLFLHHEKASYPGKKEHYYSGKIPIKCKQLKKVVIKCSKDDESVYELVKLLLEEVENLDRVSIERS